MKNRFDVFRPHRWAESISQTLAAIQGEATFNTTQTILDDLVDHYERTDEVTAVMIARLDNAIALLRARAVVLAAEVERLRRSNMKDLEPGGDGILAAIQ